MNATQKIARKHNIAVATAQQMKGLPKARVKWIMDNLHKDLMKMDSFGLSQLGYKRGVFERSSQKNHKHFDRR